MFKRPAYYSSNKEWLYSVLRHRVPMKFERWYDKKWISMETWDKLDIFWEDKIRDPLFKLLCPVWGHAPEMDHCGLPEHDFCSGCGKATSGEADRSHMLEIRRYQTVCWQGVHSEVVEVTDSHAVLKTGDSYPIEELEPVIPDYYVEHSKNPILPKHICPGSA